MPEPKEVSRKTLKSGKFIKYEEILWKDCDGHERTWEVVERIKGDDAVMIIPWLRPSNRLVVIRQFRPPAKGTILEFPAGLVEPGESVEDAAKRELVEEAGYHGDVVGVIKPSFNTPGLSGETVYNVYMELPDGQISAPQPDDGEHIEVVLVAADEFESFINSEITAGSEFDSKLLSYMMGAISERKMGAGNWLNDLPGYR